MSVQKYSEQEIEEVLRQIKELVSLNKFIISTGENRVKNDEFADEFNLDKEKRKQLILKIEVRDFCDCVQSPNVYQNHDDYFIFGPCFLLTDVFGDERQVQVYAKFVLATSKTTGLKTIVVSFHEAERPMSYYFKK
ncbi:TPA: hypothetical protein U1340_001279 [Streptococcus suis]|uniref:Glutamate racemase n=1 Tax=Streptococcus suis TaxID=1307 RepID=A0A0N1J446_STRSU|nr:hypothetical protein [Streptococcus suis]ASW50123.1 hypothetical protein A7J08_07500 [Streptococcus suis]KPA73055.1 hypothetical protein WQ51_00035 [Streptococcus suis]NQJ69048.1 hypothetical protein [Streptococcus suis]NQJ77292.1 hypothetical protein [Streptococcus suis]NQL78648.1 hypothetical protein [Streptococcus suis]